MFESNLESLKKGLPKIKTLEMHTGGEPVRIILEGYPRLQGTILEQRNLLTEKYDHLRKAIMWEPRGHADMYGLLVTAPERQDSQFGVIFMHNEGYSTMCGHATLAIAHCAAKLAWVPTQTPTTEIKIDAPCGQLHAKVSMDEETISKVSFENVPSFVTELDASIHVAGIGEVRYDIAYGGAFYAYVDVGQLDLKVTKSNAHRFIALGRQMKKLIADQNKNIVHPYEQDLSFLYGVIFTEKLNDGIAHSRNVCIFADGELDRSATGSGVSGRAALLHARGQLSINEEIVIQSILGSSMSVCISKLQDYGPHQAVVPEVSGESYFLGANEFWLNDEDELGKGFLIQ